MINIPNPSDEINRKLAAALDAAVVECEVYASDADAWDKRWLYEGDFDFVDPLTGHLEHAELECPFCKVKRLQRAYRNALLERNTSHDQTKN